jgi:hypothetical protein
MKFENTLVDLGATKSRDIFGLEEYIIQTKTGLLYVTLMNDNHLCCNFIGSEKEAKKKLGHWKQNRIVETEQDIINHIERLKL